jgi:hypothetical protein
MRISINNVRMKKMNTTSIFDQLGKSGWNHIGLASLFSASTLLLFIDKAPKSISEYLLPALIVFGLGFIVLGYIEGSIFRKNFDKEGSEKTKHPYKTLFLLNIIWFLLFVAYLFYRKVL